MTAQFVIKCKLRNSHILHMRIAWLLILLASNNGVVLAEGPVFSYNAELSIETVIGHSIRIDRCFLERGSVKVSQSYRMKSEDQEKLTVNDIPYSGQFDDGEPLIRFEMAYSPIDNEQSGKVLILPLKRLESPENYARNSRSWGQFDLPVDQYGSRLHSPSRILELLKQPKRVAPAEETQFFAFPARMLSILRSGQRLDDPLRLHEMPKLEQYRNLMRGLQRGVDYVDVLGGKLTVFTADPTWCSLLINRLRHGSEAQRINAATCLSRYRDNVKAVEELTQVTNSKDASESLAFAARWALNGVEAKSPAEHAVLRQQILKASNLRDGLPILDLDELENGQLKPKSR